MLNDFRSCLEAMATDESPLPSGFSHFSPCFFTWFWPRGNGYLWWDKCYPWSTRCAVRCWGCLAKEPGVRSVTIASCVALSNCGTAGWMAGEAGRVPPDVVSKGDIPPAVPARKKFPIKTVKQSQTIPSLPKIFHLNPQTSFKAASRYSYLYSLFIYFTSITA
jgi:hypothetical protein